MQDVWYVRKLRISSGGYSPQGSYFGVGAPVYEAWSDNVRCLHFRASSRNHAIDKLWSHTAWRFESENPKLARGRAA